MAEHAHHLDDPAHPSRVPPPHWTPEDKYDRHPKRVEDWDWKKDGPSPERFKVAWRRLNFAMDRADPRAPDQMAVVLRKDLLDIMHDWLRKNAGFNIWVQDRPHLHTGKRAIALVVRMHQEGTLSEGQCCKALDMERVEFRALVDELSA